MGLIRDLRVAYVDGFVAVAETEGDANTDTRVTSARAVGAVRIAAHQVATAAASLAVVNGLRSDTAITLLNRVLERVEPFIAMTLDLHDMTSYWATSYAGVGPVPDSVESAIEDLIAHVDAQQIPATVGSTTNSITT